MSNLRIRLRRLWVDWCEHTKPDPDGSPWPAEAFLQWAARELRTELIAVLGDDQQNVLLRELAPHVQEQWPSPPADNEHPTEPGHRRPTTVPPPCDETEPFGARPDTLAALRGHAHRASRPLQNIDAERPDMVQRGVLGAHSKLELGYQPRTHVMVTWLDGQCTPFDLAVLEHVNVTSIMVRGEEQLVRSGIPLLHLIGRQNEGLMRFPAAGPGDAIRLSLTNDSDTDLDVELRLHGVEPVKESETT